MSNDQKLFRTVKIFLAMLVFTVAALLAQPMADTVLRKVQAVAILHPTEGNPASGIVTFEKSMKGVKILADVVGLEPGKHGFHIHQWGDCSAPDATSAGGHYDPFNKRHGAPSDEQRHVGDLGNLVADTNGRAHYERVDQVVSLTGPNSIIGRAVIVHAGEDDLTTQPTGAAGARLACGVIGYARQ